MVGGGGGRCCKRDNPPLPSDFLRTGEENQTIQGRNGTGKGKKRTREMEGANHHGRRPKLQHRKGEVMEGLRDKDFRWETGGVGSHGRGNREWAIMQAQTWRPDDRYRISV